MTRLPLFPLGSIVFPQGLLSLRIFETRYIDMVRNAMRDQSSFVITAFKKQEDNEPNREVQDIGTRVDIIDFEQLPDGLLGITVQGKHKVTIENIAPQQDALLLGDTQTMPEELSEIIAPDYALLTEVLKKMFPEIKSHYGENASQYLQENYDDAGWVGSRLVEVLPINIEMKMELLRLQNPQERVRIIYEVLERMQVV